MRYIDLDADNDETYDYRGVYFDKYHTEPIDYTPTSATSSQDGNGYFVNIRYCPFYAHQ